MIMNKKCILTSLLVTLFWNSYSFTLAEDADYQIADSSKIPEILSMLASVTESNYNKIKTWEGRIINQEIITLRGQQAADCLKMSTDTEPNNLPSEIQRIIAKSIAYKIDVENNRFFRLSDYTAPPSYLDPKSNIVYPLHWGSGESIFIDTPGHQIEISPLSETKDRAILSRIATKNRAGAVRITDPRKVFYIGEKTLWLSLSQISQMLQIPNIEKYGIVIKEKDKGGLITYRIELSNPGKDRPFSVVVLNAEAGFNRTYIENRYDNGSLMSKTITDFVTVQGIFLPQKWEMSQYFPDGGLMHQEVCIIQEQQINTFIPEGAFSEFTYLKDGDSYRDKIRNKTYDIKAGNLVEKTKK